MSDSISKLELINKTDAMLAVQKKIMELGFEPFGEKQNAIYEAIEQMPTAYNVDKVVEQLEALPRKRHIIQRESKDVPEYFETIRTDEYIRVDKAIEIVRKGGVKNE